MAVAVALLHELLAAQVALERPYAEVDEDVPVQVAVLLERAAAVRTRVHATRSPKRGGRQRVGVAVGRPVPAHQAVGGGGGGDVHLRVRERAQA